MGSCISKCNPQKNFQKEEDDHNQCVKDKLVISQTPTSKNISLHPPIKKSVPPSPSSSCSSSSAFLSSFSSTVTNTTLSLSLSSSSSTSSSSLCFQDHSFSNDFLMSCAQEHEHILDIKKNKGTSCVSQKMPTTMSTNGKKYLRSSSSSSSPSILSKPPSPRRECISTPKKRPRANSPTMTRTKSFRKESEQSNGTTSNSTYHHSPASTRTTLKSPSPSQRFHSNLNGDMKESSFRRSVVSKGSNGSSDISRSSSIRRENYSHFKQPAATPKHEGKMKITRAHTKVSPKIDEMEIIGESGEVKSIQDLDSFLMEDINNPLIALDCFIFL